MKTQFKIYSSALTCYKIGTTTAEKNSYLNTVLILISSCHSLIVDSNVSFTAITNEMMRFIISSIKSNIEQTSDLIYYYDDNKIISKNEAIALIHRILIKSLHMSVIYIIIIKKCIKSHEQDENKGNLKLELSNEFGIMCRDLLLELIEKFDVYCEKNKYNGMQILEKIINLLIREMLTILKEDFDIEIKEQEKKEDTNQISLSNESSKIIKNTTTNSTTTNSTTNSITNYTSPYPSCNYDNYY